MDFTFAFDTHSNSTWNDWDMAIPIPIPCILTNNIRGIGMVPQHEDDLKMKMTSKWRRPQNKDELKMKTISKWRQPQNEDNIKMKMTLKWERPQNKENQ